MITETKLNKKRPLQTDGSEIGKNESTLPPKKITLRESPGTAPLLLMQKVLRGETDLRLIFKL